LIGRAALGFLASFEYGELRMKASFDVDEVSVGQRANPVGVDAFRDQSHLLLHVRIASGDSAF
jgi:hypothetical protein